MNNSTGTYEEPLPCGGRLLVTKTSWEISYYFPGPDQRYKGTFHSIHGARIEQFVAAFAENWLEYESLRRSIPSGGDFTKPGKMGMSIRIGNFREGVCLHEYHLPISTRQQLERIVNGYEYARSRAPKIQEFLASL
jgi:hypothetical protein